MSSRGRASAAFVEDAVFFVATIVPLAYFFGGPPILLATFAHLVSVPCAGVAHSKRLERAQTFFLGLATVATILVDLFVAAYCACRVVPTNLCCVALSSIGVTCLDDLGDAPLAVFLFPVCVFNAVRGVGRLVVVWLDSTPRARSGVSFAFVACVKTAHVVLLWSNPREVIVAHLLRLTVAYAAIFAIVASIDWSGVSSDALVGCFFLDQTVLALQTHETLAGRTSTLVPLGLAIASLVVTSGLVFLVDAKRYDAWSTAYAVAFTAGHAAILTAWWPELDSTRGAIAVAYLATPLTRTYLLRADGFATIGAIAVAFCVVDGLWILWFLGGRLFGFIPDPLGGTDVASWGVIGWGLIASAVASFVVSLVTAAVQFKNDWHARKNVTEYHHKSNVQTLEYPKSTSTVEESAAFLRVNVADIGIDKTVDDIVAHVQTLATLGERVRFLNAMRESGGGGGAAAGGGAFTPSREWIEVVSVVFADETLERLGLTRTTYEEAKRAKNNSPALGIPMKKSDEAKRFVAQKFTNACKSKFVRRWTFATARHSYRGDTSLAKTIETLWKVMEY